MEPLIIAGRQFSSRLFTGTGKFSSHTIMESAMLASGSELVTVALKRVEMDNKADDMLLHLVNPRLHLLPNTIREKKGRKPGVIHRGILCRRGFSNMDTFLEI